MNPQADNGVFDARMCGERSAELYTLQSVGSSLSVSKVRATPLRPLSLSLLEVFFAFVLFPIPVASQRYVELRGEAELFSYRFTNEAGLPRQNSYFFTCVVSTNEWRIDHSFSVNGEDAYYYDGTNVYHRIRQLRDAPPLKDYGGQLVELPFELVKSNCTISIIPSPGGHPIGDLGVNIPWLAYCSGDYLRQTNRAIPLPTAHFHEDPFALGYSDISEVFSDELGLPKSIDLFTSQEIFSSYSNDARVLRWPPPVQTLRNKSHFNYPDGILKFHYEVRESTNFGGWTLPREFQFVTYDIDASGATKKRVGGVGKLLSINEARRPENVFLAGFNQTIADYRFRHPSVLVDGIRYRLTNATQAPSTSDPVLRNLFERGVKNPPPNILSAVRSRRIWAFAMLFISTVMLIIIIRICMRKSRIQPTNNQQL